MKTVLMDQVKWSGCVRESLTDRQSTAGPDYHKGEKSRRTERKRKDKSFKCGKRTDQKEVTIGECIASVR